MSVVEVMTFRLREGAVEDEFLAADRDVQTEFVPTLRGFLRRTTARAADGEWAVVTLWASDEDAEASAVRAAADVAVGAFMALAEPTSVRTRRYATLD